MENKYLDVNKYSREYDFPYSDVVEAGDTLYISGLVAEDLNEREEFYGTIQEETCLILDNLAKILEQFGSDMDHVCMANVLIRNWDDKAGMNEEYVKHFKPDHLPARILSGGVDIADGSKVEISFVATKK